MLEHDNICYQSFKNTKIIIVNIEISAQVRSNLMYPEIELSAVLT